MTPMTRALFSSYVIMNQLENEINNDDVVSFCYERYAVCPKPKVKGGWQSAHLDLELLKTDQMSPLMAKIEENIIEAKRVAGIRQDVPHRISNYWVNIGEPGHYHLDSNTPHVHPGYWLNIVYYPKADQHAGDLYFLAPFDGVINTVAYEHLESSTGFSDTRFSINPAPGTLVIFPSWLTHWVLPNYSDSDRISIAFNVSLPRVEV